MDFSVNAARDVDGILRDLSTSREGLSEQEVALRQKKYGQNVLPGRQARWYDILLRQLKSPFLYLLIGAAIISFALYELLDGMMILLFVGINIVLGFVQEYKSEKTLALLKAYVVATARVMRNGKEFVIPTSELVPGDIIVLQPGDVIPADIRFFETENISVDESILTGESVTVPKDSGAYHHASKGSSQIQNIGYSGTNIVSGEGRGIVIGTGKNTSIGKISSLTTETSHVSSFEKGIGRLSSFILKLIVITLLLIFFINILIKGTTDILTLIIFSIALAISVIPEALPVVTTFSFSRGALHLAKHKVIVKRLSAIEDIGSIDVLCTDKTGTITENKLTVDSTYPSSTQALLYANLAIPKDSEVLDPFDNAVQNALSDKEKGDIKGYEKIAEVPFDPIRRRNSVLVNKKDGQMLIARGAFEHILPLCKKDHIDAEALQKWIQDQGAEGKRVLAVAKKSLSHSANANLAKEEHQMEFVGLVSFIDPLKKTSNTAIVQAERLGVKIKILTGDSKEVAGATAAQIGLIADMHRVMTGQELDSLPVQKQHAAIEEFSVFARVSPQQKHKIIQLLKEKYEVGFLGEGINDAPALKAANVAIVVQGASAIAQDAADIVLLNKSLLVVVDGIEEGRKIFGNTAKYIKATLASNFGNFYTVAISSLFIPFLPLLPLQILLINLMTDFPMIAVATDTVDSVDLKRPRNYDVKEIALFATVMGIVSSFFDFLFFLLFYKISPSVLQTNWFIGSVLTELVFVFSIRSRLPIFRAVKPSPILLFLSGAAFLTALILPFTTFGQDVFSFVPPTYYHLALILFITLGYFVATEIVKNLYYTFVNNKTSETHTQ